jgi:hypothetical protein
MADGSSRRIADIREGAMVWNPLRRAGQRVVRVEAGPERIPMFEVAYHGRAVKVTETHPFLTRTGVKQAKELAAGDQVVGENRAFYPVTVRKLPVTPGQQVWNFKLEAPDAAPEDHMVVAGGVVAGDLTLQQATAKARELDGGAQPSPKVADRRGD